MLFSPFNTLIDFLKLALAGQFFVETVSLSVAPLKDNEELSYQTVFLLGNCRRFLIHS